jgi:ribonuclease P protein component
MRMKSRGEFARVRRDGKSYGGRYLVLGVLSDPQLGVPFKYGVILTRKVGNAVTRNRIRRRVRSVLSEVGEALAGGHYIVTIARHTAPGASFEELRGDWKRLARKAGLLSTEPSP